MLEALDHLLGHDLPEVRALLGPVGQQALGEAGLGVSKAWRATSSFSTVPQCSVSISRPSPGTKRFYPFCDHDDINRFAEDRRIETFAMVPGPV